MGFITPTPPPFEIEEWKQRPHLERIKLLAQDWALNGFGTPSFVYLLYVVKLIIYAGGGLLLISATTEGLGGVGNLGSWWTEPIVFQKAVVWTMLWEILGLGAGSLPLTLRFAPMIGGVLYWLRPGTTRLPPWPDRVPLTRGTTRGPIDVALYAGVIAWAAYLLLTDGISDPTTVAGRLDPGAVGTLLALLGLLGLRDKVPFLAARAEIYGNLMILFLFPLGNMIVAAQIVFVCIWWGAASSKLNRHFPFVVTVMISNTPWNRWRAAKRRLYRNHPEDLRPSSTGALAAHMGTVMEFTLPLVLLFSKGGTIGTIAVVGMVIFHLHILSTFPLAVPLEWNIFMIFGILFLFGHYGATPLTTLDDPLLIAIMAVTCVGIPVLGNFRPDLISFLPSMRYYAGNWATSQWLFRKDSDAEEKLDSEIVKPAPIVVEQLTKFYDREMAELLLYKGLAFRSMHSHGRALNGLLPHAVDDVEEYHVREGELIAGVVLGYNFGDGHFHNQQLLEAVQERCHFEEGELRMIAIESQPANVQRQRYRIYDAATGLVEEGWVNVADMVERQPWLDERPFPTQSVASVEAERATSSA
ncbi:MAG TPA: DUF3556 domain-containing protein [Solirubrobacterales bacterium]|jgi:hypothetical protein